MSESRPVDSVSGVLLAVAMLAGLGQLAYRPFLLCPIGVLILLIGSGMSTRYRRLGLAGAFVIATCFVIGAGIAVWDQRALY
jgi:hypothetical protein